MSVLNRTLSVLADGREISRGCRVCLRGAAGLSLYPALWTAGILNLSDSGRAALRIGKEIAVLREGAELARGVIQEVQRLPAGSGGAWTVVGFSLGLDLWEAEVSLSAEAGLTAEELIRRTLEASGTPWHLLNPLPPGPAFSRGWALSGRAAEAIETLLASAGARGCLTPSGLIAVSPSAPVQAELSEADLTDQPVLTRGRLILSTLPIGWPVGRRARLTFRGRETTGLILRRSVDADTLSGPWNSQLLIEPDPIARTRKGDAR